MKVMVILLWLTNSAFVIGFMAAGYTWLWRTGELFWFIVSVLLFPIFSGLCVLVVPVVLAVKSAVYWPIVGFLSCGAALAVLAKHAENQSSGT